MCDVDIRLSRNSNKWEFGGQSPSGQLTVESFGVPSGQLKFNRCYVFKVKRDIWGPLYFQSSPKGIPQLPTVHCQLSTYSEATNSGLPYHLNDTGRVGEERLRMGGIPACRRLVKCTEKPAEWA